MSKTLWWVAGAAIVIVVFAIATYHAPAQNSTIKIGAVFPLTGGAASFGLVEKHVTDLAVEEINNAGGINGKKIQVLYEDGKCAGQEAVSAAQKLINIDKVDLMFASCGAETLAIAPVTESRKMILFASYSTSPLITNAGDFVFRNAYSDADMAHITAQTLLKRYKKIGVLFEQNTYSSNLKDAVVKDITDLGGVAVVEGYPDEAIDVRTQIEKVLAQKPDAVYLDPNDPNTGITDLKQLKALGWNGPVYGNYFGGSTDVLSVPEADGMIFFADPTIADSPLKQTLWEKYKQRFGEYPTFEYPGASRYDAVYILKQAIEKVGLSSTALRDYFYSMPDYTGVLGTYHFDKNGDVVGVKVGVKQIKNGKVVGYAE